MRPCTTAFRCASRRARPGLPVQGDRQGDPPGFTSAAAHAQRPEHVAGVVQDAPGIDHVEASVGVRRHVEDAGFIRCARAAPGAWRASTASAGAHRIRIDVDTDHFRGTQPQRRDMCRPELQPILRNCAPSSRCNPGAAVPDRLVDLRLRDLPRIGGPVPAERESASPRWSGHRFSGRCGLPPSGEACRPGT